MTEMKARLVDKDGNPLGTAANPLKISGDVGGGVPDGGTTGQVLQKKTDADQDTEWGDGSGASTAWGSITGTLSDQTDLDTALDGKASKTASDLNLYVYEDATGSGDGSSKANGFTSLQAAIDAIPDVAQNVTIIVSKGSTNYLGDTTTMQKASVKSLTIRGEFYAYESCDANAVAGKVVDASADFSDFEVGDRVVCTKYSGTVGASSIDDYFYATITEVGEGYIQTSETTKVPTTGWRYLINQTVFDGNNTTTVDWISSTQINSLTVNGCFIEKYKKYGAIFYNSLVFLNYSTFKDFVRVIGQRKTTINAAYSAFLNYTFGGISIANNATSYIQGSVFDAASASDTRGVSISTDSKVTIFNSYFRDCNWAVWNGDVSSGIIFVKQIYIASTCTYGVYGYNITLVSCTNNATTPVYNLTSGGSIEEWDGQALPSIADATGGQVLALKSDKSGFEFATVSSGGGITWNEITGTTQSASADNGYITNNESLVTVTLPSTCAVGNIIRIIGKGAGGWKLAQNSGQSIRVGMDETTEGTSGYIESGSPYDSIEVICVTTDTEFSAIQSTGVLGVV